MDKSHQRPAIDGSHEPGKALRIVGVEEVAARLGITSRRVQQLRAGGVFRNVRHGHYVLDEAERQYALYRQECQSQAEQRRPARKEAKQPIAVTAEHKQMVQRRRSQGASFQQIAIELGSGSIGWLRSQFNPELEAGYRKLVEQVGLRQARSITRLAGMERSEPSLWMSTVGLCENLPVGGHFFIPLLDEEPARTKAVKEIGSAVNQGLGSGNYETVTLEEGVAVRRTASWIGAEWQALVEREVERRRKPDPIEEKRWRRYLFKLYPTRKQAKELDQMRLLHCDFYNAARQQRMDAYRLKDITVTSYDQARDIKTIRADNPEYAALSFGSLQLTLRQLDRAYETFWGRVHRHEDKPGYPKFKEPDDFKGFSFRRADGWTGHDMSGKSGKTYFLGVPGGVKWRGEFPATPHTVRLATVMRKAGAWWLSVVADMPRRMSADEDLSGKVTFDLVDNFAQVSCVNSEQIAGPDEVVKIADDGRTDLGGAPMDGSGRAITLRKRGLRRTPGSHKHRAYQRRVAKRIARTARRRRERLHVWTTQMARRFSSLKIICPSILEASKSSKGNRREHGSMVEFKTEFNRHIRDQASGMAVEMLQYKIEERQGETEKIVDRDAAAMIASHIVEAAKLNRDLRKATRNAP